MGQLIGRRSNFNYFLLHHLPNLEIIPRYFNPTFLRYQTDDPKGSMLPADAPATSPAPLSVTLGKNLSLAPFPLIHGRHAPNGAVQPTPLALILVKFEEEFFLRASMSDAPDITPQVVLNGPWQLAPLRRTISKQALLNLTRMQPNGNPFPAFVLSSLPSGPPARHVSNGAMQVNPSALIVVKIQEEFLFMLSLSVVWALSQSYL